MNGIRGQGHKYKQKGSRFWWIKYYDLKGEPVYMSTKTESENQAERILQRKLAAVRMGIEEPKTSRITVDDLMGKPDAEGKLQGGLIGWYRSGLDKRCRNPEEYAERSEARWNGHLKAFFGGMQANQVGTEQIIAYRAKRTEEKASPGTINRELAVLRKAYKRGMDEVPPKVRVLPKFEMASEEPFIRRVFISEEDKQKLRQAARTDTSRKAVMKGPYLRAFVELLFAYGWRKGELTGLRVKNVNLAENLIRIETSKNGEAREVVLTPSLAIVLQDILLGRMNKPEEPLFPAQDMRWAWKRLCKAAGVKPGKIGGVVMHDGRRTTYRTKRAAGVSDTVICKTMGWKPGSKMAARYGIVDNQDKLTAQMQQEEWERQYAAQQGAAPRTVISSVIVPKNVTIQSPDKAAN